MASAPSIHKYADLNNTRFAEQDYRYFGLSPAWIVGEGKMIPPTKPEVPARPMTRSEYIQMYGF